MTHSKSCRKAAVSPFGLKKAVAYLEGSPLALLAVLHLLALVALVLLGEHP
ncbi:hypothetical protein [Azotobacter beijerinckii]|uniref:Uncharacterized protein n=1 Tax=Azotobacter beijerinckii TaxID=170623 RepID=A0A1I1A1J9_9GAMM|nr:hypothetical protein [Azotobacter beijerinckii]SFB31849.1 hypothetical protein SAMN04244571_02233 [Azotobacter beijerinckii]